MQNPRGEWMVLLPHTPKVFLRTQMGSVSGVIRQDVIAWLIRHVGLNSGHTDVHSGKPWRERVWSVGSDSSHCFFFLNKKDAILFKLVWS